MFTLNRILRQLNDCFCYTWNNIDNIKPREDLAYFVTSDTDLAQKWYCNFPK